MKKFFLLYGFSLIMAMGLTFSSCSNDDDFVSNNETVLVDEEGYFVYDLELDCGTPDFENEGTTRALSYTWDDNATIYVRFKDGTSYIPGTATYNKASNKWTVRASSSLAITNEATCYLFYFDNAESVTSEKVNMNEKTSCYYTYSATYKHPTSNSISITAALSPYTWRMRFKGTNGTQIKLPGTENGINYYTSFNRKDGSFTHEKKDITLSVSGGYTPYIYGEFDSYFNSNITNNPITLINNTYPNYKFSRNLKQSDLLYGTSGYFNIPTSSSYSGWERTENNEGPITNCSVTTKDLVTFTDAIVFGWNAESNVNKFYYKIYTSMLTSYTDDEIVSELKNQGVMRTKQDVDGYIFYNGNLTANTNYYIYAVAFDSNNKQGTISISAFKTRSSQSPYAEISNIKSTSSTKWTFDITLKNNATSYYLMTSTDADDYTGNWHWIGYYAYQYAISGQAQTYDWTSVQTTLNSGTCQYLTVCTWGVSSSGTIGNCHVATGYTGSSAPLFFESNKADLTTTDKIRLTELEKAMKKGKLILIHDK